MEWQNGKWQPSIKSAQESVEFKERINFLKGKISLSPLTYLTKLKKNLIQINGNENFADLLVGGTLTLSAYGVNFIFDGELFNQNKVIAECGALLFLTLLPTKK